MPEGLDPFRHKKSRSTSVLAAGIASLQIDRLSGTLTVVTGLCLLALESKNAPVPGRRTD